MNINQAVTKFRASLPNGFELRGMGMEEFKPLFQENHLKVFADKARVDVRAIFTEDEALRLKALGEHYGTPLCFRFGIFKDNHFVGWHIGDQKSPEEFYMRNSGILPEFQGKGLYTAMLNPIMNFLKECGFQVISSKHNATNNRVIVPKLKAGFVITGLEISDKFGTMVRLEHFTNPVRREIVDYRCGQAMPSETTRPLLGLG
ncbi:hypothetical protein E3A20_13390 [Planctomyces bekefii]|uniref:N-acetyltransferase domain-containing protein n=1 Tax=Planctomyces bekefii TaxID=1653850 RepID=A0A5C6M5Q1_9PLAN|nr:hypothetical protein E3A20_13390 [Planctomyces bekefii]